MKFKKTVFVYICNAIDEQTKVDRLIITDSPAATNKVVGLSNAVNQQGWRSLILSLGRGRQNRSGSYFGSKCIKRDGLVFCYASFLHLPVLTHIVTIFSLTSTFIRVYLKFRDRSIRILVYNRSYHYLPTLILAKFFQLQCYLDLEDGYNKSDSGFLRRIYDWKTKKIFNWLCPAGGLVASSSLISQINYVKPLICYGVANDVGSRSNNWNSEKLRIIFSGTLLEEVGSQLLIDAFNILRIDYSRELEKLFFVVTGKGSFAQDFSNFAIKNPRHVFFGKSLPLDIYTKLLRECHVGISLRLSSYEMAKTTFPSKVIEYANNGLVLLTTKSPDIPRIFGNSAIYLEEETPDALAKLIASLPNRVAELEEKSLHGMQLVRDYCGSDRVGRNMVNFFSNASD